MAEVELFLLGSFSVSLPGRQTPNLRRKTRALLAYLAVTPQAIRRQELSDILFPESNDPLGSLRWQLSAIRRQLDPNILIVNTISSKQFSQLKVFIIFKNTNVLKWPNKAAK